MAGVGGGIKDSKATFKQSHCLLAKHSLANSRKDIAAIVVAIIIVLARVKSASSKRT